MKTLSTKNLKKETKTLYVYKGEEFIGGETTQTTGTDPTNTTITIISTTHIFRENGK
jgi:hypothetical protein